MSAPVVTGIGLACPLGIGARAVHDALLSGAVGIFRAAGAIAQHTCAVAAVSQDLASAWSAHPCSKVSLTAFQRLPRHLQLALIASRDALADAGLIGGDDSRLKRTAACIGSGMPSMAAIAHASASLTASRRLSPLFVAHALAGTVSGAVAQSFGLRGGVHAPSVACATGLSAIADAARLIATQSADIVLAGATDAAIEPLAIAGFAATRALIGPDGSAGPLSMPFGMHRRGFVMGEGAAMLVMESEASAQSRGARILGRIVGWGHASHHGHLLESASSNDPNGHLAMLRALAMSKGIVSQLACIFAHATSTRQGDASEAAHISRLADGNSQVYSEMDNHRVYTTATKSALGHMLGAAGAADAILAMLSLATRKLPAMPPYEIGPDCTLSAPFEFAQHNISPDSTRTVNERHIVLPADRKHALVNAFGFGGADVAIVVEGV